MSATFASAAASPVRKTSARDFTGQLEESSASLATVKKLIADMLAPKVIDVDLKAEYPQAFLRALGAAGGYAGAVAPEFGGNGLGLKHVIQVMEEASKLCLSTGFLIWCQTACARYIQMSDNAALKASFLPRITLNGDAGFQAKQLDDLDGWNAHRFSNGQSISLPIFQGGRLKANLALSRLQQQQSALQFRRTVLQAWHEVDDAMDGYSAEQQRTVQLHVAVDESETALGAARRQYQAGVVDMLDVLTTQRIALDNQAALANSQAAAAIARVELYRALGGGW